MMALSTVPAVSNATPALTDLTRLVVERARRKAEHGYWLNSGHDHQLDGYEAHVIEPRRWFPVWRIDISEAHPVTFVDIDGAQYRSPLRSFRSDFGTIPRLLQVWIPATRYPCSFLFHDLLCDKDGLDVSEDGGATWETYKFKRSQADEMLYHMVLAEKATRCEAWAIYTGVRGWAYVSGQWR